MHNSVNDRANSHHKLRIKRIITKRERETLCELDTQKPIVERLDEEDVIVLKKKYQGKKNPLAGTESQ